MGYETYFTIDVDPEALADGQLKGISEKISEFWVDLDLRCHTFQGRGKWYSWEEDLRALSLEYPGVMFSVHLEGDESSDLWNAYIQDGKAQLCQAEIIYPAFDRSLMV